MLILDVETTYGEFSHFKNPKAQCYCIGAYNTLTKEKIVYRPNEVDKLNRYITKHDIIHIGNHNLKYDLHWLLSLGFVLPRNCTLWDTQTVEYLLSGQSHTWASLNDLAQIYNLPKKLDKVKTEYWDKGIDTKDIPWDVLSEYCLYDCELTGNVAEIQEQLVIQEELMSLVLLVMMDYKILTMAEYYGLKFDYAEAEKQAAILIKKRDALEKEILEGVPYKGLNIKSPEQLSALLYGGEIVETIKVPDGVYGPTAQKAGQIKFKNKQVVHSFPRRYKPLPGTEKQKPGVWSTDDDTLTKLGGKGGVVTKIQEIRKINKELDTYFLGLINKIHNFNWPSDKIYGKFNTCATRTGRLSSSEPNLQNMSEGAQRIIITRY